MTNPTLPHRRRYADDPTLCDRVFALLDTWIPALSGLRRLAERLHWRWEDVSTPFVHERDGRILSHVGVLESRMVCNGVERLVGGIHAVCTLESERRRGLYRVLMQEVLAHCAERYETLELCTEHPEFYEPFGFRVVPEHRFVLERRHRGSSTGFRALDLARAADAQLLDEILDRREPVSQTLGVLEKDVFKFNAATFGPQGLQYCPDLDLLAVVGREGDTLEVYDLVAPEVPDLETFLSAIEGPFDRLALHFRPDRLGVEPDPLPFRYDGDVFMVRGDFPFGAKTLPESMLPPPARH